ncbi:DsbA family protein [Patescibacteria group bacterium]|nr:DsbA family protein [Patescibacteria group bacterium]
MTQQQKVKVLIVVLLVFLFLATTLILVRFIIGKKILSQNQQNIDLILKSLKEGDELELTSPIFKTSDPALGNKEAENVIFEFGSFACHYCRQQAEVFDQLFKKYPQQVFLVWKDAVSPLDPLAAAAALAARCAQAQDRFWQFHDYLFINQESLGEELYQNIAVNLNLDINEFNRCLAGGELALYIESDIAEAGALGVDGTPYLFINGQRFGGVITLEELEEKLNLR